MADRVVIKKVSPLESGETHVRTKPGVLDHKPTMLAAADGWM
jgi:hypothetical protein